MPQSNTAQTVCRSRLRFAGRAVIAGAALFMAAAPSFAAQKGTDNGKTQKGLESEGYTCVAREKKFNECTKPGHDSYWCDQITGRCMKKPKIPGPKANINKRPAHNWMVIEKLSGHQTGSVMRGNTFRLQAGK